MSRSRPAVLLATVLAASCAVRAPHRSQGQPARIERATPPLPDEEPGLRFAGEPAVVSRAPVPHVFIEDGGLPGLDRRVNQDLTVRAQNEVVAAVDPANPLHIVAAWCDNQLFYFDWNLQKTDLAYGVTFDGGQTWQSSRISFSAVPAGAFHADPSIVFDSAGNIYLAILRYSPYDRSSPTLNKVFVAKSTDGGLTYGAPVQVEAGAMDKPLLAASGTTLYVVWTNSGSVRFAKSTNGGTAFTGFIDVTPPLSNANSPVPVVGPAGEIYVLWADQGTTHAVWFDKSQNGGANWGTDTVVAPLVTPRSPLVGGFRNHVIPALAVDRSGGSFQGRLYAVWPDGGLGDPDVLMSWSADGGSTWSTPLRVNDDAVGNDADQFLPWVAVDQEGTVHVAFLDRRESLDNGTTATYLATSTDGGVSFGPNVRISDGAFAPADYFAGDYDTVIVSGNTLYAFWPDARQGDQDLFTRAVDLDDFDGDTRLNDGDGDGQYAKTPCTGGAMTGCDDNCPGKPNFDQADGDVDGVGDACDNCPGAPNTSQTDDDRDAQGNACDGCPSVPGKQPGDPDGDGVDGCADNCPELANGDQTDGDADGLGDACDPCPVSDVNDVDGDGRCGNVDNCPLIRNFVQRDADLDGIGDLCDKCPDNADPTQPDDDFDGAGNACDCAETQLTDFEKRKPPAVEGVRILRTGSSYRLVWKDNASSDTYSVSRGLLSTKAPNRYGPCLINGVHGVDGIDLPDLPPPGDGYFYVVIGWDSTCGLGSAGVTSNEARRINTSSGFCIGGP